MGNVISFKKGAEFLTYEEGTVYFDESSHTIKVGIGENQYKEFSGVKTVNGKSSDDSGNVSVKTFSDVPGTMDAYKKGTLEDFCKQFLVKVNPEQGSAYLTSGIAFTNLPKSFFDHSSNPSCELFIYVPMRSGNNVVFNLEITTTNCFEEQWYGGPGKWMAICQVENGTATLHMPWRGVLSCPQTDELIGGKHRYIPVKDSDSVSKYYLDQWMSKEVVTEVSEQSSVTISHSFLKSYPNVVCVDSSENLVQNGTIHYDSNKQITITFSAPFTGKIIIN